MRQFVKTKIYCSRAYWNNYIDTIIDSIKEDKDTIIDLLINGKCVDAKLTKNLSVDCAPNYDITVNKLGEKSPFVEDDNE